MDSPKGWLATKLTSRDPLAYLSVFVLAFVAIPVVDQLWPGITVLSEVDISQVVALALAGAGVWLWVRCESTTSLDGLQRLFLGALLAVWILAMALSIVRSPIPQPSAVLTGILVLLVWLKPPNGGSAGRALDVLGWSLVVVIVLSVALEGFGLLDGWYASLASPDLVEFDRGAYWLPLADVLGIEGRWAGPFVDPNRAGVVGALLMVLALRRRGWSSWVFMIVGLAVLTLTASRTSQAAALVGIVLVLLVPRPPGVRDAGPPRAVGVIGALGAFALIVLSPLPRRPGADVPSSWIESSLTFSGRESVWPTYYELWSDAPWTGLGTTGILEAIQDGTLPVWASDAHSLVLDVLARYGLIALALVAVVLAAALVATLRDGWRGQPLGLGIVAVLLVAGLGQTTIGWIFPEVTLMALILAVLLGPAARVRSEIKAGAPPA